jgi:hypothetical protein
MLSTLTGKKAEMVSPDPDMCTICGSHKTLHTHQNHRWTNEEDPQLIPVAGAKAGSNDRSTPPRRRESPQVTEGHALRVFVRLIEVLTVKNLLTKDELLFIFGGNTDDSASADGSTDGSAGGAGEENGS